MANVPNVAQPNVSNIEELQAQKAEDAAQAHRRGVVVYALKELSQSEGYGTQDYRTLLVCLAEVVQNELTRIGPG
jgi:hypothetical protein